MVHLQQLADVEVDVGTRSAALVRAEGGSAADMSPCVGDLSVERKSVAIHEGRRRYDLNLSAFLPEDGDVVGSSSPLLIECDGRSSDPMIARLASMLEVPGLIHAMVMAEKAQSHIDVDMAARSCDPSGLGVPLAERFNRYVFSLDAFYRITDPARSAGFLDAVRGVERREPV